MSNIRFVDGTDGRQAMARPEHLVASAYSRISQQIEQVAGQMVMDPGSHGAETLKQERKHLERLIQLAQEGLRVLGQL